MDNHSLDEIINRMPLLKYKYLGSYPADFCPEPQNNSFVIVNIDSSFEIGSHWVMIAKKGNKLYFGDSLGRDIRTYKVLAHKFPNVIHMIGRVMQKTELCGLYAIYFAYSIFNGTIVESSFNDVDLLQFMYKFY